MIRIRIDSIDHEVPEGMTVMKASEKAGIEIPHLCHAEGLPHYSSCMVCMVKDNRSKSYIPSCSALVQEGMDIDTSGSDVIELRKKAVDLLLSEHRAECEAPCRVVCPAGYNIPLMNRLLSSGDFEGAVRLTASETYMPEIACVQCPGYCENACRRKKIDLPVSIRNTKLFIAEKIKEQGFSPEKSDAGSSELTGEKLNKKKRFRSLIGKIEADELNEWLKESGQTIRFREIEDTNAASSEAASCMHCDCRAAEDCRLRDIADEFSIKDPRGKMINSPAVKKINHNTNLIFENAKCIKCGLCVRVCEDNNEDPPLCFIHRGFVSIISEPLTTGFDSTMKKTADKCIGICPTGALSHFLKPLITILLISLSLIGLNAQSVNDWPVYRGTSDLTGRSVHEITGNPGLLWTLTTGARTKSSPVISEGVIYFGNDKGTLFAITPDGKIKWKFEAKSPVESPPLIIGNKVIIGTSEGSLRAIDKTSGILLWTYMTDNQIAGSANFWTIGNRSGIVVGSYDYCLHCVDPVTGKMVWKVETDNFINGAPAVSGKRIVFGGCDGFIRVIDPLSGKESDTCEVGVYIAASPALYGDKAYFGDYEGTLYNLDLITGKMIWKTSAGEEPGSILAVPAVGNDVVIVGNDDKNLYCFDRATGKMRWKFRTNGQISGSAVITSDKVLFTSMDGNVYLLKLADGTKIWNFYAGSPVSCSPAVIKDNFVILTEDGRVLSFGEKIITKTK